MKRFLRRLFAPKYRIVRHWHSVAGFEPQQKLWWWLFYSSFTTTCTGHDLSPIGFSTIEAAENFLREHKRQRVLERAAKKIISVTV